MLLHASMCVSFHGVTLASVLTAASVSMSVAVLAVDVTVADTGDVMLLLLR